MKVRLELDSLNILVPKENWEIYFILISEDTKSDNGWLVHSLPESVIRMKKLSDNHVSFRADGDRTDGLRLLETELEEGTHLMVRIYVLHSRSKFRSNQELVEELLEEAGDPAAKLVFGLSGPWLSLGFEALPVITRYLRKIGDRDLGMVSMDERFDGKEKELTRKNSSSTGEVELEWRWIIEN